MWNVQFLVKDSKKTPLRREDEKGNLKMLPKKGKKLKNERDRKTGSWNAEGHLHLVHCDFHNLISD